VSNGKASFKQNRQNLLLAGLLALTSPVFGQTTSFVIECNVSGQFIDLNATTKITNQPITVGVDHTPPNDASAKVEGSGYLNIGIITFKNTSFSDEQISLEVLTKTPDDQKYQKYTIIKINRITGFIEILNSVLSFSQKNYFSDMTVVSGFCSKASNKPKF